MRRITKVMYIYDNSDWPEFYWNDEIILPLLLQARKNQGIIIGKMGALGFELKTLANLDILTIDIIKSSEIEGEILNLLQVRSSIARHLGLEISGLVESDSNVDGIVDMMLDATIHSDKELNRERLFAWHKSLFSRGYSGMSRIITGTWRSDSKGPMQVVSGPVGKQKIHFQAPEASRLESEMKLFLDWINNSDPKLDLLLKAGIAHLWFVTLHPFEDGNGRIARAITDMILARSDGQPKRFYSMSAQIRKDRKQYYQILEETQKSTNSINITRWLEWFLICLLNALKASEGFLSSILFKNNFHIKHQLKIFNARQKKIINKLLEGFDGKLTSSKYAKICNCSQDTALRDIQDLIEKGILHKLPGGGRSTAYDLIKE